MPRLCHLAARRWTVSFFYTRDAASQQQHFQNLSYRANQPKMQLLQRLVVAMHKEMVNAVHSLSQHFFARRTNPPLHCGARGEPDGIRPLPRSATAVEH
jgi:hypothetical protein